MKKSITAFLFSLITSFTFAQSGTIFGTVKDATNGEGVIGANVYINGTTQGAAVDFNGEFEIPKVKAGTYTLIASFISYKTDTFKNITIYPDKTTVINVALREDVQELESVVVTARKVTNTDISVISELKKSDVVAVGISSQMIQMSQDRDAAQVIRRVPGVTIVGNRFVNVRGLSERYSTVMLNGVIAPSTEVDSKAFAFDLIPSGLIDRMLVYKSGSAALPGEFAGADISIYTKNIIDENSTSFSISGSQRFGTTGKGFKLSQEKGSTDFIGSGNEARKLPTNFPSENLRILSQNPTDLNIAKLANATKLLPNRWGYRTSTASPDLRATLNISRTLRLGNKKFDNVTSLNYAHTNQRLNVEQYYYEAFDETNQKSGQRYKYNDVRFNQTNRLGVVSNFTFEFNPSNRIEFRNFYNQQGQNQSTFRQGQENLQGVDVNNEAFNYYGRKLYSGQLSGKHNLSEGVIFDWIFGYNQTNADQPDYRRIRSQRTMNSTNDFTIVIPPGASAFDAGRFFSKLDEKTYTAVGNVEIKLNPEADDSRQIKLITGYYMENKERNFKARWMSYKWLNPSVVDNSLLSSGFNDVFVNQNLGSKFILEEGTNEGPNLYDKYKGINNLIAGHTGIATPIGENFRLSAGVRIEYNVQQIYVTESDQSSRRVTNSPLIAPMPFVNLSYNLTENQLLRVAYSRTVNRPVFRELAPFNYYDFDRNADAFGNPNLKTAKIDNMDLRWELYPSNAETISLGAFYKKFTNPIEQYLIQGSNLIYSFTNADEATNYGVEAEVRRSLEGLTSSEFINDLTVVMNGALINSAIKLPASLENLDQNRSMQGQSPYIFNSSIFYNNYKHAIQFSVMYNVFGKRIFAVGDKDQNATQYQMPRNQIDLTVTKQFGEHLQLKVGIQDILNQRYRLVQDSNRDGKITSVDEKIQSYRKGQYSTLGLTWKF